MPLALASGPYFHIHNSIVFTTKGTLDPTSESYFDPCTFCIFSRFLSSLFERTSAKHHDHSRKLDVCAIEVLDQSMDGNPYSPGP